VVNPDLFVERIQSILKDKNVSQGKLAKLIGYTPGIISKYINKERVPTETAVIKIAFVLNVNPKYLTGEGNDITAPQDLKEQYNTIYEEELLSAESGTIFSKRLKILSDQEDKLNKKIASSINVSAGVFSNYVNGKREPDFNTLADICRYFDVSADYMIGISYSKKKAESDVYNKEIYNLLTESGMLDLIMDNHDKKDLFIKLLKHTCETFNMINKQ
jgi:Predicted transcriptional regulators